MVLNDAREERELKQNIQRAKQQWKVPSSKRKLREEDEKVSRQLVLNTIKGKIKLKKTKKEMKRKKK